MIRILQGNVNAYYRNLHELQLSISDYTLYASKKHILAYHNACHNSPHLILKRFTAYVYNNFNNNKKNPGVRRYTR